MYFFYAESILLCPFIVLQNFGRSTFLKQTNKQNTKNKTVTEMPPIFTASLVQWQQYLSCHF